MSQIGQLRRVGRPVFVGGDESGNGAGMDRDVELELTRRMASLEATLTGFAKDVTRRFDDADESLSEIKTQVLATNGRVTKLERENAVRTAIAQSAPGGRSGAASVVGVITLAELKWWIAIAMGSGTFAVSVTLWVLKVAGKL